MKNRFLTFLFLICNLNASWAVTRSHELTYQNTKYGFTFRYPDNLVIATKDFYTSYFLRPTWRALNNDREGRRSQGTLLISLPVFRINQNGSTYPVPIKNRGMYPVYYDAELRIGVSADPFDVKNCITNSKLTTVIHGIVFHVYSLSDVGMSQYMRGKSYRVVHHNQCFAVEQLVAGSAMYLNDSLGSKHVSEQELAKYDDQVWRIIQTLIFIR